MTYVTFSKIYFICHSHHAALAAPRNDENICMHVAACFRVRAKSPLSCHCKGGTTEAEVESKAKQTPVIIYEKKIASLRSQ